MATSAGERDALARIAADHSQPGKLTFVSDDGFPWITAAVFVALIVGAVWLGCVLWR
jgi:hypothetical protein